MTFHLSTQDSNMKKFVFNIILFSLICIATLFVVEVLLVNKSLPIDYYRKKYNEIYNKSVKYDLIIIGASHGVHGINPKKLESLGVNAYNFCLNGANPSFTLKWLNNVYLRNNKMPNIIIYEVNWFMFDEHLLWRRIEQDSIYLSPNDFISFCIDKDTDKVLFLRNRYKVLSEGGLYKHIISNNIEGIEGVLDEQYYKGYIPQIRCKSNRLDSKITFNGNNNKQINDFKKIIDLIKNHNSRLILVQSPEFITNSKRKYIKNNDIIRSIARDNNLIFLNYNEDMISNINFNKEFYYDAGHLNQDGSTIFSDKLARDLNGLITQALKAP